VVIPDLSVSRFHAFMKRSASGTFLVQDAGSTNGTTVNGASVLARGSGPPTEIKAGDNVRVGQLEFTFVDAVGLRAFALQSA
jgi:pSer/pThr/pTyr-binding forkhead associated (FHA) protein